MLRSWEPEAGIAIATRHYRLSRIRSLRYAAVRSGWVTATRCAPDGCMAGVRVRADRGSVKSRLDARLLVLVEELEHAAARTDIQRSDTPIEVTVYYTGALDDLVAAGLELAWHGRNERVSYALG